MATGFPYPPEERLECWIRHLDARAKRLADVQARTSVEALGVHLRALGRGDPDEIEGTITWDARLRIWGWERGHQVEYAGPDLRQAYQAWRRNLGESVHTVRVDVDRFFPGRGRIGLDGVLSAIVSPELLPDRSLQHGGTELAPDVNYLVARRVAWFATVDDRRLSDMDLYVGIRQTREVHRRHRPTDRLDRQRPPR